MAKRILVAGGTGLLGRPVAQQLVNDGFEVRVLARSGGGLEGVNDFEFVAGDVQDADSVDSAVDAPASTSA
jgi:nucleoside-diphosphate-sugar epimerase